MAHSRLGSLRWLLLVAVLLQSLLFAQASRKWKAAPYNGLIVGESSRTQVIRKLGKPKYEQKEEDTGEPTMNYSVTDPIPGDLTVYVRGGILRGLTLTPSRTFTETEIIARFGRDYVETHYSVDECLSAGGTAPLYENPTGSLERIEYRSRGLAIVMRSDDEVQAIVFEGPPFLATRSRCSSKSTSAK